LSDVAVVTVLLKTVTVGEQSTPAYTGEATDVSFDVTTENISPGEYDATLTVPVPDGWTFTNPGGKITIDADGKGKLDFRYDGTGTGGTHPLSVMIDGTLSKNPFELKSETPPPLD
jgi:hypothetical protein